MNSRERFNPRSDARQPRDEPGIGDDVPCVKCGAVALDTGLECYECGHDNYEALTVGAASRSSASQMQENTMTEQPAKRCVNCGKKVPRRTKADGTGYTRSIWLFIEDKDVLFCTLRCAAEFGIKAARKGKRHD